MYTNNISTEQTLTGVECDLPMFSSVSDISVIICSMHIKIDVHVLYCKYVPVEDNGG